MLEGVVDGGTLFSFIIYAVFLILSILHFLLAKEQTSWKRKTIRKRNHLKQTVVSKTGKCPSLCFFWFHDCRSTYYIKQDNQNALEMLAFFTLGYKLRCHHTCSFLFYYYMCRSLICKLCDLIVDCHVLCSDTSLVLAAVYRWLLVVPTSVTIPPVNFSLLWSTYNQYIQAFRFYECCQFCIYFSVNKMCTFIDL